MTDAPVAELLEGVLRSWRPPTVETTRTVDPWPSEAFAQLVGGPSPTVGASAVLPPMWHGFTLLESPVPADTGSDGHPQTGPFLPPVPHRRRMFAGGRLRQHAPVRYGDPLRSRSAVSGARVTSGRSGAMLFVTVRHELFVGTRAVATEEQDVVYRSEPERAAPRAVRLPSSGVPPAEGGWRLAVETGPTLLFRFSALTYNGHRIHYDLPYATGSEGYPGLVVHGPLLALLALELPRRHAPAQRVESFSYRLTGPAFSPAAVEAVGRPAPEDGGRTAVDVVVGATGSGPSLLATVGLSARA